MPGASTLMPQSPAKAKDAPAWFARVPLSAAVAPNARSAAAVTLPPLIHVAPPASSTCAPVQSVSLTAPLLVSVPGPNSTALPLAAAPNWAPEANETDCVLPPAKAKVPASRTWPVSPPMMPPSTPPASSSSVPVLASITPVLVTGTLRLLAPVPPILASVPLLTKANPPVAAAAVNCPG